MKKDNKSVYAPFKDCPPEVKEFLDYMLTILGRSPKTVDGYYIEIRTFLRFLLYSQMSDCSIDDFKKIEIKNVDLNMIISVHLSDIYDYLNFSANELSNSAYSRSRKVSALKSFYNYLHTKTTYLKTNPLENLELPKQRKTLPKFLSLDESNRLLDSTEKNKKYRDVCILTLFLNCGMRLSELVGIDTTDIHDDRTVRLLGKGNKERVIYLNSACISSINNYLIDSNEIKRQNNALFVTCKGIRLSNRRVEQIVEACLKNANLSGMGISPHKLRHTAATLMYRYGNSDVRVLKEILGHANLATTEIYTHVSNEQVQNAIDSSPLAKRKQEYSPAFDEDNKKEK